jgi:hypothetical protein
MLDYTSHACEERLSRVYGVDIGCLILGTKGLQFLDVMLGASCAYPFCQQRQNVAVKAHFFPPSVMCEIGMKGAWHADDKPSAELFLTSSRGGRHRIVGSASRYDPSFYRG